MATDLFTLTGTPIQQDIIRKALTRIVFPWDRMVHGLQLEGRTGVEVAWEDLSRYSVRASDTDAGDHVHVHLPGGVTAHPIQRQIEGRARTLGLFYLPPHTRIVLDSALVSDPTLAMEVFGCEAAHAVDYHTMSLRDRWEIVNILHTEDLPAGSDVSDGAAFHLDGHTCSWFDVGPYEWWVGEAFMETFVEAFSDIPTTSSLAHPTNPEQAAAVRQLLVPPPEQEEWIPADVPPTTQDGPECSQAELDLDAALATTQEAMRRYEKNKSTAAYLVTALRDLSKAAEAWRAETPT